MADSLSSSSLTLSALPSPNMCSSTPSFCASGSGVGVHGGYEEEDDACSVCLEPFSAHDPPTVTICKHEYHLQCILEWSQRSKECPICWRQLVLKDPSSQELLVAVEAERKLRSRTTAPAAPVNRVNSDEFDTEQDSYSDDSDFDERILQHLAAASAASRAHYTRRRDVPRSFGGRPSHVFIFSPTSDRTNQQAFTLLDGGPIASSELEGTDSPAPEMPTADRLQLHSTVASPARNVESGGAINSTGSFKQRVAFWRAPAESPGRPGSSEMPTFSESVKSKWSTASSRYKESITKGARGIKEKLLSRNNSVKELSKGVQKEMSAGLAGVARMFERLDLAPKHAGTGPAPDVPGGTGFPLKGKGLLEEILAESMEKRTAEVSHDAGPNESSFVSNTTPVEVTCSQRSQ